MKKIIAIICLVLSTISLYAKEAQDSLLLKIDKRNQTLLDAGSSKRTLREELEIAFSKKGLVLSDSLWQDIRKAIKTDSDGDSSLSVRIGNSQVKIGIFKSGVGNQQSVASSQSTVNSGQWSGKKEEVRVGLDGVHVKDGNEETHVTWDGVYHREGNEVTKVIWGKDSTKIKRPNLYSRRGLNFYLGLNALTGVEPELAIPYPGAPAYVPNFTLDPMGSRYASIEISRFVTLSEGKKSAFRLGYGLEIDWYNFRFDHNRIATKGPNSVQFTTITSSTGKEVAMSKNKMSVSYLTLPIMPHFVFDKKSAVQMIAIGGYMSYRLDTWTKAIEEESGNLRKETSNLYVNPFRYGVRAEFALRHFPDLFFSYDLSPLFEPGKGPEMRGLAFGIRLL
ncbi:outer membrane beta-barrel protein [Aquirufa lenticrescens]|uniref:outer membrane beta-barrel protein n=1 Tax=Aquirufa lenticrescens TaxID=2696560 RepID=UPI001CAA4348|nr:outer membrane beta-barrel protein [Aquirufa lenticrescens]UAJ13202.1 PorT family protein [Aquirufa lenticrescens]